MNTTEIVLIDLSSIAYPIWHMSQSNPDANATSQQTIARVRALANGHKHVAVCCDAGRSFRKDVSPEYKANRPEHDASLQHQIKLATEQLAADGFPIWGLKPFEADDLVASATARALATPDLSVLIVSADKDLLQLVNDRVRALSANNGTIIDSAGVKAKFGVTPEQMRDYLIMVGDNSDNVKGVRGIGPKTAAELLTKFGSLDNLYTELESVGAQTAGIKPSCAVALKEFRDSGALETTLKLISLRTDAEIPFDQIRADRVPAEVASFGNDAEWGADDEEPATDLQQPTAEPVPSKAVTGGADAAQEKVIDLPGNGAPPAGDAPSASRLNPPTAMVVREADVLAPAPAEYERQLDPRSMQQVIRLARDMYDSRMFSAYGTPQGVMSSIMLGRELGLPAMASLRQIHIIEGKHALSASLMVALVLKSGFAEFFEPVEFDHLHAIVETKRKGARNVVRMVHTIEMAKTAQLLKPNSNWEKIPTDMLLARAQSRLCRLIYPDIIGGLYTPDELIDARAGVELREGVA